MRFEELSKKVIEQHNEISVLTDIVNRKQRENEKLFGLLHFLGMNEALINLYSLDVIEFASRNIVEARGRYPDKTDLEILCEVRLTLMRVYSDPDHTGKTFITFKEVDRAEVETDRKFEV